MSESIRGISLTPEGEKMLVVEAGISENGFVHKPTVLKEALAAGVFKDGTRAKIDHRDKTMVSDLVGSWSGFRYEDSVKLSDGRITEGVVANFKLFDTDAADKTVRPLLEAQKNDPSIGNLIGPSIEGMCAFTPGTYNGREVRIVESYREIGSIDIVVDPSAGVALVREATRKMEEAAAAAGSDNAGGDAGGDTAADTPDRKQIEKEIRESVAKEYRVRETVRETLGNDFEQYVDVVMSRDPIAIAELLRESRHLAVEKSRKETPTEEPIRESANVVKTPVGNFSPDLARTLGRS